MKSNCFDTANMFSGKSISLIYKLTNGNYRDTNKLLYSVLKYMNITTIKIYQK